MERKFPVEENVLLSHSTEINTFLKNCNFAKVISKEVSVGQWVEETLSFS